MSCDLIRKSLIMLVFTILINKLVNLNFVNYNNILRRLSNILLLFIYLCVCLPMWDYVHHLCASVCESQKRSGSPRTWTASSHHVDAGNWAWVLSKSGESFLTVTLSLESQLLRVTATGKGTETTGLSAYSVIQPSPKPFFPSLTLRYLPACLPFLDACCCSGFYAGWSLSPSHLRWRVAQSGWACGHSYEAFS